MTLALSTPFGRRNTREDKVKIRTDTIQKRIPIMTTLRGAAVALNAVALLLTIQVNETRLEETQV